MVWGVSKARFIKAINIAPTQSAKVLLYANLIPGDKVKVTFTTQLKIWRKASSLNTFKMIKSKGFVIDLKSWKVRVNAKILGVDD